MTDLSTFHDYADGPELEKTCANLDTILGLKAGRELFTPEITGTDPGCKHIPGTPIMCTEFGGVNIDQKNVGGEERNWGYTTATDPEDLLKRVDKLVKGVIAGGHCCAFVYTQLWVPLHPQIYTIFQDENRELINFYPYSADIEQETNGLYSFERKEKLDSLRVKALMEEAIQMYYARLK